MNCPCGFDSRFFEVLKNHFDGKAPIELNGLILVDEMSTRKNLLLDQKRMKFTGVEDFGTTDLENSANQNETFFDENLETDIKKNVLADHGLVIMFQPLYDNYSQPIAVFASKGPTTGNVLAKLLVQAIVLLEKAGTKIHGIVADGGAPNRKVWTEMGCSGKMNEMFKNWFEHPLDEKRKVFFFSDMPHLMKTIRNRLASSGKLQVCIYFV